MKIKPLPVGQFTLDVSDYSDGQRNELMKKVKDSRGVVDAAYNKPLTWIKVHFHVLLTSPAQIMLELSGIN